jgi:hypothetical protein
MYELTELNQVRRAGSCREVSMRTFVALITSTREVLFANRSSSVRNWRSPRSTFESYTIISIRLTKF